jgi:hypothetical protein
MRESSGYQLILDEGGEAAVQRVLLRLGTVKFGSPGPDVEAAIRAIHDLPRLERMSERLLTVSTWQDLLAAQ